VSGKLYRGRRCIIAPSPYTDTTTGERGSDGEFSVVSAALRTQFESNSEGNRSKYTFERGKEIHQAGTQRDGEDVVQVSRNSVIFQRGRGPKVCFK